MKYNFGQDNLYILIYDSECIFCSNFVKYLDIFCDKKIKNKNPIYIIKPSKIDFIEENIGISFSNEQQKYLKDINKDTIIFLNNDKIYLRVKALIKLALFLRPNSLIIKILNKYFLSILTFLLNPFYKLFARNRYKISNLLKNLFPQFIKKQNSSCLFSTERIKFL
mgnify:CR=1 FL=1